MTMPRLLGIGGAHIDRRGKMDVEYIYGASIPGKMMEEAGGGVFNALRTAAQFQTKCAMLSVRGADTAGELVASEIARRGIEDLSAVFLDRATATYTALLNSDGDVVTALADMSIYETALPRQITRRKTRDAINTSDGILIDANMPERAIIRLLEQCNSKPVFAIATSPAKAVRLCNVFKQLACLFLNHREARAILSNDEQDGYKLAIQLKNMGLSRFVLTAGADNIWTADQGKLISMTPPQPETILDVTGAGDALTGATIAALLQGTPFIEAVQKGVAAAAITVMSSQVVADFTNSSNFETMLAGTKP